MTDQPDIFSSWGEDTHAAAGEQPTVVAALTPAPRPGRGGLAAVMAGAAQRVLRQRAGGAADASSSSRS